LHRSRTALGVTKVPLEGPAGFELRCIDMAARKMIGQRIAHRSHRDDLLSLREGIFDLGRDQVRRESALT
jgi:hypothetical protein